MAQQRQQIPRLDTAFFEVQGERSLVFRVLHHQRVDHVDVLIAARQL